MPLWEIEEFIKHQWAQLKTNDGYRYLITRSYVDGEYVDNIEFVRKEEIPKDAKSIRQKGKYWFYVERNMNPDVHDEKDTDMTAITLTDWGENDTYQKSLANKYNAIVNLDWKTIGFIAIGVVVAVVIFSMIKP